MHRLRNQTSRGSSWSKMPLMMTGTLVNRRLKRIRSLDAMVRRMMGHERINFPNQSSMADCVLKPP